MKDAQPWPVVWERTGNDLTRIAMPVGGIGTGCISLGGRGQLIDWELFNRPAKGHNPDSFFAIHVSGAGGAHTRALEGALLPAEYDGHQGSPSPGHGLPRFENARFASAYPLGQVQLSDPTLPVTATLQVFNPLVPGDADASGLPALVYRARVHNPTQEQLSVSICGNLQHVGGYRPGKSLPDGNVFEAVDGGVGSMLVGRSTQVDPDSESWGTLAIASTDAASSTRTTWARRSWGDSLLDFWDDFSDDGQVEEPDDGARVPTASLVVAHDIPAGESRDFTFVIAWHIPNRRGWSHQFQGPPDYGYSTDVVGNHYATRYADAAAVVRDLVARLPELEDATLRYVRTLTESDLPGAVVDAALSNVAVLKSPTCFRIEDGTFLAWEGGNLDHGSCHGSCTHVWNYQYALEQLFPDLAWTMRTTELVDALDERGMMSFRIGLPLKTQGNAWRVGAADGQMGALVRLHRTWLLTGDDERLRELWASARRAMEFAWIPLGWDADQDGLMEGCQHNTMDVEYYGPSGVNQSWYLGALAACVAMAEALGDTEFAGTCADVLRRGAAATDATVFNGDYYQQVVMPAGSEDRIAEGLRIRYAGDNPDVGSDDLERPDLQIGSGCTSDQLVGHTMAQLGGLDTGLDAAHTRSALDQVWEHNRREEFRSHFNHLRSFALGADRGLLNGTFPRGDRPERPFPYCNEVWTGLEYSAAVGLALQGDRERAETVVRDVRGRYTGRTRNPFNEVECGNHYVRSMASFGLVHGWAGAVVDQVTDTITADPVVGRWPVVVGGEFGHVVVRQGEGDHEATYEPVSGDASWRVVVRERLAGQSA
ncbi:GH116 family glycosyl-hydrolase [Luteipulveratus mongoliensis]|uniref:GH116 family glycosyl-hydrolase n=1 Tax=Luteipulveratus mongoliensis TaxID=571913 RepID=UPI0009FA893C|nr:GH116 family glycosyl-hydrolase [Luteipulveratus mongoliensis]